MKAMWAMMEKLKLTVNETKTHQRRVPLESFDFLGYTFGQMYWKKNGRPYIGKQPSLKRVARIREAISEMTDWRKVQQETAMPNLNQRATSRPYGKRGWRV